MKKTRKYVALVLAILLTLSSLSGALAQEIGDQITFAYYVDNGQLCQIGVLSELDRPADRIVVQPDQATVYYWTAPTQDAFGRLYAASLLSSEAQPTLISDQVYGQPVYVEKDSRIYFLDANDTRLLKAVAVAPYEFNTVVEDVAVLPAVRTNLSASLEGLHVEREITAGLYVNRYFDAQTDAVLPSTLDPQGGHQFFGSFETQQQEGLGLQLRAEVGETWRLLSDRLADCQAAWGRDLFYSIYDETTVQTSVYVYNVDSMQTELLAIVYGLVEHIVAYGDRVALLTDGGVLRITDRTTGLTEEYGDYGQTVLPDETEPSSAFDLRLAGNYLLVYGVRAETGAYQVIDMIELPVADEEAEPLPTATLAPTATPTPTATPAPTPVPYTTLQNGSRGEAVQKLQARLNELGYSCGTADGVFGEKTRVALLYFQDQAGLTQDGVAGMAVQKALYASDAPRYVQYIEKTRGDRGIRVQNIQERLRELGYLADAADGQFGRRTQDAVKLFQEECGLRVTGVASVATQRELFASDAPICSTYITLQRGDSGKRVTELNKRLVELGYLTRSSSRFAKETEEAVQWFQSLNGLTVSGVADTKTLKAVFSSDAVVAPTPTATPEPTVTPEPTATAVPTDEPTAVPTDEPTAVPTAEPTAVPTDEPTTEPTAEPTAVPTDEPTAVPTAEPTALPTDEPTAVPTDEPTAVPTDEPTAEPTDEPTAEPTAEPIRWAVTREQVKVLVDLLNGQYPADPATYTEEKASEWLQKQLILLEYLPKDFVVNSVYDQATRDAVTAFQKAELTESEIVRDDETWGVVDGETFLKIIELVDALD